MTATSLAIAPTSRFLGGGVHGADAGAPFGARWKYLAGSGEVEMDAVFRLGAARAVAANDLDELVKERRALPAAGTVKAPLHGAAVRGMNMGQQLFKTPGGFSISQRLPRPVGVEPLQHPPVVWRSEASSEDVIERIEVATPGVVVKEQRELPREASQVVELQAVDDKSRQAVPVRVHLPIVSVTRHDRTVTSMWRPGVGSPEPRRPKPRRMAGSPAQARLNRYYPGADPARTAMPIPDRQIAVDNAYQDRRP